MAAEKPPDAPSKFFSAEGGWADVSGFLDDAYGFVPVAIPITEPAVGYGTAGGLTVISEPLSEAHVGFGRRTSQSWAGSGPRTAHGVQWPAMCATGSTTA